jgi:hypothetical protein
MSAHGSRALSIMAKLQQRPEPAEQIVHSA